MRKAHIVTGQTGTGKTTHAIKLAQENGGHIVSVDSRQVYTHLDIVTGKDVNGHRFQKVEDIHGLIIGYYKVEGVKVWGYDIMPPDRPFSSSDYKLYVDHILSNTIESKAAPIVEGGTYFYLQDLLYDIGASVSPDWSLREKLEEKSIEELHQMLSKETLASMNDSDRQNPRRLIRRIEIAQAQEDKQTPPKNETPSIQSTPIIEPLSFVGYKHRTREDLRSAITKRVEKRVRSGAFEEAQHILKLGYSPDAPGLQTIGYREIFAHLNGTYTREEAIQKWITSEMQYAKRQLTFMRKDSHIVWHDV